jgi:hypothetical protein
LTWSVPVHNWFSLSSSFIYYAFFPFPFCAFLFPLFSSLLFYN